MTILNIELPDHLKKFAEREASANGMSTLSEYVQALLAREEQRQVELAKLEAQLLEGLNSGPSIVVDEAYWAKKRADLIRQHRTGE